MNIFPDVVLFYSFLYAVVLLGLLSLHSARVHKLMHTRLRLRLPCAGASTAYYTYVSCGALIFAFLFLVLFALWVCYWALNHDFAYSGGDISLAELWARVFGQIGNLFLALLILPQSRNSIWSHTFGVSWYVRECGWVCLLLCVRLSV